jgi:DNA-binding MarR family transcriptional regulator
MTPGLHQLSSLDRTIHEPARLMLMTVLYAVSEADFLYLQDECGLTPGNLSSHLAKLEQAGYVLIEKKFKRENIRSPSAA